MNRGTVFFAWRRTPPPFFIGGAEVSQRLLAEELAAAGWRVVYLGTHRAPWGTDELPGMLLRLRAEGIPHNYGPGTGTLRYTWHGIDCHAVRQESILRTSTELVEQHRPSLVICSQEGAAELVALARRKARVAAWVHAVSNTSLGALDARPDFVLATSLFAASRIPVRAGRAIVFYPPFQIPAVPDHRSVWSGDLLMINPVPAKGSALLQQLIAQLPERHFTLVEGWWDTSDDFAAFPNVTYLPQTDDLSPIYAGHRLLLVPSLCEDAFPRVIIEAALHGLPALGSNTGGVHEALGDHTRLLPPDDIEAWYRAIASLCPTSLGRLRTDVLPHALRLTRPRVPELIAEGVLPA